MSWIKWDRLQSAHSFACLQKILILAPALKQPLFEVFFLCRNVTLNFERCFNLTLHSIDCNSVENVHCFSHIMQNANTVQDSSFYGLTAYEFHKKGLKIQCLGWSVWLGEDGNYMQGEVISQMNIQSNWLLFISSSCAMKLQFTCKKMPEMWSSKNELNPKSNHFTHYSLSKFLYGQGAITYSTLNSPCFAWHPYGKIGQFKAVQVKVTLIVFC